MAMPKIPQLLRPLAPFLVLQESVLFRYFQFASNQMQSICVRLWYFLLTWFLVQTSARGHLCFCCLFLTSSIALRLVLLVGVQDSKTRRKILQFQQCLLRTCRPLHRRVCHLLLSRPGGVSVCLDIFECVLIFGKLFLIYFEFFVWFVIKEWVDAILEKYSSGLWHPKHPWNSFLMLVPGFRPGFH